MDSVAAEEIATVLPPAGDALDATPPASADSAEDTRSTAAADPGSTTEEAAADEAKGDASPTGDEAANGDGEATVAAGDSEAAPAGEPADDDEEDDAGEIGWADLTAQLELLAGQVASLNERAKFRESVIDRLHEENQQLKAGGARLILEPTITGLIRLHGLISREAERVEALEGDVTTKPDVLRVFLSEVELLLDGCGIEPITAAVGEELRSGDHRVTAIVDTTDEEADRTLAAVLSGGFRDRHSGRARAPVAVAVHRWVPAPAVAAPEEEHEDEPASDAEASAAGDGLTEDGEQGTER